MSHFKPGTYYIGDLCYVMDNWEEVCDLMISDETCLEGHFNLKNGVRFAIFGTEHGDGSYPDDGGNMYAVDSGTIGCIALEDIDATMEQIESKGLGHIVVFEQPFEAVKKGSILQFGRIQIDTDPVDDEDQRWAED